MSRFAILAALVAGCTVERDVLVTATITTCEDAVVADLGAACAFAGTCTLPTLANPLCCDDVADCKDGRIERSQQCKASCASCRDDTGCEAGKAICDGSVCVACPIVACPACPANWVPLERNGCPTCDCAPKPSCGPNVSGAACVTPQKACYVGADCTAGCAANDEGCCTHQCADAGCTGPIPTGCLAVCPGPIASVCHTCAATQCDCVGGAWQCMIACVDGAHASCVAP